LKSHSEHRWCSFHEAVTTTSKEILDAQKACDKVIAKVSFWERKVETAQGSRRFKAEALKREIEQTTAALIQRIMEERNQLLQEVKTFVRNQEQHAGISASHGAKQRLETSMHVGGQMLSTAVRSPEKLKLLKNNLEQVKKAKIDVTHKVRDMKPEPTFPSFVDRTGQMKALGLGFLKPFSRATKFDEFNVTISSQACFLDSVAILPDGSCTALAASVPDIFSPRALFIYCKEGRSQRVIKSGVGLAVDLICHNGHLVVLRREKPYVSLFKPEGGCMTLDIEGELDNPWSLGIDTAGRFVITHGELYDKLALVRQECPRRLSRLLLSAENAPGETTTEKTTPNDTADLMTKQQRPMTKQPEPMTKQKKNMTRQQEEPMTKQQKPMTKPQNLLRILEVPGPIGAFIHPNAGKGQGPGRLSCGKEIYCAFDQNIIRYIVIGNEIISTRSGVHDIKDFTIHGVKMSEGLFVVGEIWEDIRVYEVSEPSEGREGWAMRRVPLFDSDGGAVELTGRSSICFDIRDNIMLIGYTDAHDRGHMHMFRLGPV
jgi:hypothetical protein